MVSCRAILSFVLVLVWMAIPALACLPASTMTQVEMECCKKMAGDCHMGSRSHPCCEKNVNQTSPVATVERSHRLHAVVTVAVFDISSAAPTVESEFLHLKFSSPPHSPPSLNSPLRI